MFTAVIISPRGKACIALLIFFVYFIVLNVVKIHVSCRWNFELIAIFVPTSARRNKLAAKKANKIQQERVWQSIDNIRKVTVMTAVVSSLSEGTVSSYSEIESK
ncbi:hypothetical protein BGZ93_001938 [Podila epicladia]|nr:hypothetical protein BGZ93_001938 [Podila epicladia]